MYSIALNNPLSALPLFLMALIVLLKERKAVSLTLAVGLLLEVIQILWTRWRWGQPRGLSP